MKYEFREDDAIRFKEHVGASAIRKGDELFFAYCPYCNGGKSRERDKFSINLKTGDLYNMIHEAVEDALMKQSTRSASTLLTRDATAKRLGVDVSTLWRWDKSGYLKPVRIGRSVHYRLSDIEARERGEIINQ